MWHERLIQRIANVAGLEVKRLCSGSNPSYQLKQAMEFFSVDTVLDVGANVGQFGIALRAAGFKGQLVSFEPLSSAHHALTRAASGELNWRVHERGAIGDFDGETTINISGNSVSSSLLPMTEAHESAAQASAYVGVERVPIFTLDSVAPNYLSPTENVFLKIDTQGYEWQVLDGARTCLPRFKGILCELSLVQLYEGQRLWRDVITRLESEGFTLWAIQKGFTDAQSGRALQMDVVFFRN